MNTTVSNKKKIKTYPLIAIAASAGNFKAITEFLKHLPPGTGMPFVYIQPLGKKQETNLMAVLSRSTKMKVQLAESGMKMQPDCLFVVPSYKHLEIKKGVFSVTADVEGIPAIAPIDSFFISLADSLQESVVGILLSDPRSDGSIGLKAIKMAGGLTFASNNNLQPETSLETAGAKDAVDRQLSPKEIAREVEHLGKHVNIVSYVQGHHEELSLESMQEVTNILQLIKNSTGADFEHYKINTISRRIKRRMLLNKLSSFREYFQYLAQNAEEINMLHGDLLINVTYFFRDPEAMNVLRDTLMQQIREQKPENLPVRIWVPACSTGEEAYTIAMILLEVLGERADQVPIQIFATDISETAIAKARAGIFSAYDVANISPQRLQLFFIQVNGSFHISKSIRKLCVFAVHNILKDPPFTRLNLISCRNLIIYLDNILQKRIMNIFYNALNENGLLLLGKSETVGNSANLFTSIHKKAKLFARKNNSIKKTRMDVQKQLPEKRDGQKLHINKPLVKQNSGVSVTETIVDNIFLRQYAPPGLLINHDLEIIQFRGVSNLFLEPAAGKASLNILKMVHPGLVVELRRAIYKCIKTDKAVKLSGIQIQRDGQSLQVAIEALPVKIPEKESLILIVFNDLKIQEPGPHTTDHRVRQLENQLVGLREDLRSLLEEQEAANEDLQTANEEIVSSNEELQSINEELETSKEEIESTNEELMSINSELILRNDQLAESKEYTEVVIASIREAVIILDRGLQVKSANEAFYRIFQLKQEDTEGRMIYELGNNQWNIPRLKNLLEELLPKSKQLQGFEIRHKFPQLGEKVLLLDARQIIRQPQEQTILLSIEDITQHRKNEQLIAERVTWFRNMSDNVPVKIWVAGPDRQFTYVNKTWLEYTGRFLEQEIHNGWIENIHPDDVENYLQNYKESFDATKPFRIEYRIKRHDGEFRWHLDSAVPTYSPSSEFIGFTGSCIEIHSEKLMNEELEKRVQERTGELKQANNNLERSNHELEQFAYVASHDLQEPLRKILTFSDQLEEEHADQLSLEGKEYIAKIIASSERMTQLIDDLLDFSRITQSRVSFVETDLNEVLQEILTDFEVIIKEKRAQVILGQPLPVIWANKLQMQQLFHNLISNSLKFSIKKNPPVISVTSRQLSSDEVKKTSNEPGNEEAWYEIVLKDNGIGFNQEYAEQVFTIFQRLHDRKEYPGTGIGLALCRKIVENHNGTITVHSTENSGTSFFIILPKGTNSSFKEIPENTGS